MTYGVFAQMAYILVDRVFTVVFHTSLCAFRVVASRVVFDFVSPLSDTCNGRSLSITSAYRQIRRGVFSTQLLWVLPMLYSV